MVRRRHAYFVAGTLSLVGRRVAAAEVDIQRQAEDGEWVTETTLATRDTGWWYVRLRPGATWKIRAHAAGDPAAGLADEYSVSAVLEPL